jgi:tRNA(Ile)-lysidine synthase
VKEEFLSFISKHRLISPGERVLVAFSGGADSTCLLHLLSEAGFEVAAAHLHHSQRPEGDADVDHCRRVCEKLGVAFYSGKADVPGVAKAHKMGIEEAGRKLRYEFFQMMAAQGYQKVATGHTLDDNLESMLLHLARGTGMRGLAGIPVKRGNVIRPILAFSREQTHAYCAEHGLTYVSDSYNEDEAYARNLVRNQVVKRLKEVNSSVAEHAFTTARILTEENELLDSLAASHLQASEIPPQHPLAFIERTLTTSWSGMENLPTALLRRCIRLAAGLCGGSLDFDQTQAIAEAIQSGGKISHTAEGAAVSVTVADGRWRVTRTETAEPFREMLTIDGETIADDLGWSLAAWRGDTPATTLQSTLDGERIKGDLYVRSLKRGDKIDPPGRGEAKLLADRLARAGIPLEVRQRLPVVCDMLGPVWAPVIGPDKRCAATPQTANPISLRLSEIEEPSGTPGAV